MKNIVPDFADLSNFDIEDFCLVYTPERQIATLEMISQIFFFADGLAKRGFGRDAVSSDFDRVTEVRYSVNWGGFPPTKRGEKRPPREDAPVGKASMSKGTLVLIRKDMEAAGLFQAATGLPKWVKGQCRSAITRLTNIDLKKLALLARKLWQSITAEKDFEDIDREHHWGGLAAIVMKLTGCSLFSTDDDYTPDEAESERRKGERLLQAYAELENWTWGGVEYRDLIADRLRRAFGPDWPDLLPF